jgi:hypothetical protein
METSGVVHYVHGRRDRTKKLYIYIYIFIYCGVYRGPVSRQRPRNDQRVQPLLCSRQINNRPFLSNGSVSTIPRNETHIKIRLTMEAGVLSM